MEKLQYFENTVLGPTENDTRGYVEYEDNVTYEWINDLEGIVNLEEGKEYECNGSYAKDGTLAALVYGYANDLDILEISEHSLSDRVNMHSHKGFQILSAISDKRIFEAGDTEHTWMDSFVRYIEKKWQGFKHDGDGNIEMDSRGLAKPNYTYDYIWIAIPFDKDNVMFESIKDEWIRVCREGNIYYIRWINQ